MNNLPKIFTGVNFVLAGRFSIFQYEVNALIAQFGGKIVSFVDKQTHVAIVGADPSHAKMHYIDQYKVPCWTEEMLETKIRAAMAGAEKMAVLAEKRLEIEDYGTW